MVLQQCYNLQVQVLLLSVCALIKEINLASQLQLVIFFFGILLSGANKANIRSIIYSVKAYEFSILLLGIEWSNTNKAIKKSNLCRVNVYRVNIQQY